MTGKIFIENYEGRNNVKCKVCTKCCKTFPLELFEKRPSVPIGVSSHCKFCILEKKRKHYAKNSEKLVARATAWKKNNPEKVNKMVAAWRRANPSAAKAIQMRSRKKYPHKRAAQAAVEHAVSVGKILSQPCCVCKKIYKKEVKAHAHHCDYNKQLDVMWLCPKHHKAWHRVFLAENA